MLNEAPEAKVRTYKFKYWNYKEDPNPEIIYLGTYKHPDTGNRLVVGINLHYLSDTEKESLKKDLIHPLKYKDLTSRVRKLLGPMSKEMRDRHIRSYDMDYIDGSSIKKGIFAIDLEAPDADDQLRKLKIATKSAQKQKLDRGQKDQEALDKARLQQTKDRVSYVPEPEAELDELRRKRELERGKTRRDLELEPKKEPEVDELTLGPDGEGEDGLGDEEIDSEGIVVRDDEEDLEELKDINEEKLTSPQRRRRSHRR